MKNIFLLVLLFVGLGAIAQIPNGGMVQKMDVRTEFNLPFYSTLPATGKPRFMLYDYNGADSALYVRSYDGTRWIKFSGNLSANNGVSFSNNNFKLGGPLIESTNLNAGNNNLSFTGNLGFTNSSRDDGISEGTEWVQRYNNLQFISINYSNNKSSFSENTSDSIRIGAKNNLTRINQIKITGDSIWFQKAIGNALGVRTFQASYENLASSVSKYKIMALDSNSGAMVTINPSLIGSSYTASEGVSLSANNFKLGGLLTENRTINAQGNSLTMDGTADILKINGQSGYNLWSTVSDVGVGVVGHVFPGNTGAVGVLGIGSDGIAGHFRATNGTGLMVESQTATAGFNVAHFVSGNPSNNTVTGNLQIDKVISGTPLAGFGTKINIGLKTAGTSTVVNSTSFQSKWTNPTYGTETSDLDIINRNNGSGSNVMTLKGNGQLVLPQYIGTNFNANISRNLAVDATGNIITAPSSGDFVVKPSSESLVNSIAYQADDHLFYNLISGSTYKIEIFLIVNIQDFTSDFNFRIDAPAFDFGRLFTQNININNVGVAFGSNNGVFVTTAGYYMVRMDGFIKPTTSGNVSISWAQDVSSATPVTMVAGSYIKVQKLL